MINFLSWEKKKNEPLRPAPSPALRQASRLNFGLRDAYYMAIWSSVKNSGNICSKIFYLWYVILTFWSIFTTFFCVGYWRDYLIDTLASASKLFSMSYVTSNKSCSVVMRDHLSTSLIFIWFKFIVRLPSLFYIISFFAFSFYFLLL
jgi:hypothetical protein